MIVSIMITCVWCVYGICERVYVGMYGCVLSEWVCVIIAVYDLLNMINDQLEPEQSYRV